MDGQEVPLCLWLSAADSLNRLSTGSASSKELLQEQHDTIEQKIVDSVEQPPTSRPSAMCWCSSIPGSNEPGSSDGEMMQALRE